MQLLTITLKTEARTSGTNAANSGSLDTGVTVWVWTSSFPQCFPGSKHPPLSHLTFITFYFLLNLTFKQQICPPSIYCISKETHFHCKVVWGGTVFSSYRYNHNFYPHSKQNWQVETWIGEHETICIVVTSLIGKSNLLFALSEAFFHS